MSIGFYERRSLPEAASLFSAVAWRYALTRWLWVSSCQKVVFQSVSYKGRKEQQPTEVFRLFE